jgi:hypothetical protein
MTLFLFCFCLAIAAVGALFAGLFRLARFAILSVKRVRRNAALEARSFAPDGSYYQ